MRWWLPTLLLLCWPGPAHSAERPAPGVVPLQAPDPDRLYADRERLESVVEAAAIWQMRVATNPKDFESAWKLSRACYWLGGHVTVDKRREQFERGIDAGRRATELEPTRPEGYFWMAADMGAMAESFGLRAGLKYRAPIKRALETVLTLAPGFQNGSADRALGRWYLKVPSLFGGSRAEAISHLRRSLTYDPTNAASHFFLFETYQAMDRTEEARDALKRVLEASDAGEWGPETREFKEKARAELARMHP